MRTAETILGIIRDRGRQGLPLEDMYRQLFNPALYLLAYGKIGRNAGALTPGVTPETMDGMSLKRIQAIIDALRMETYRWTPVRRVYIEKKRSTKKRPLGIPAGSDKLLQEVLRLILEAYYEPQFSDHSHGFRPGHGCGTALTDIYQTWTGTTWFIEGDITACFDSFDHQVLLSSLREHIHDNRFLRLIENLLKAGYLEDWKYRATLSGAPQGGVVSPILSNIYLGRLDTFVEQVLIPAYTRGRRRRHYAPYDRLACRIGRARKQRAVDQLRALRKAQRQLPSRDPQDPTYRRLRYVRYADDFLLGFAGPRSEAEEIKRQIGAFLQESLKPELSEQKTLITHARTEKAHFLGYEVCIFQADSKLTGGQRSINGDVGLRVPLDVVKGKCKRYMHGGKPVHLVERTNDSVLSIVAGYELEYAGVVNYYRMAYNLSSLGALRHVMGTSLVKTLAHKLRLSAPQVWRKYQGVYAGHKALIVVHQREDKKPLVAVFSRTDLKWRPGVRQLDDDPARIWSTRTELVERLVADTCELCGSQEQVQVHHIRKLADLTRPGRRARPAWVAVMAARQRKTLIVCGHCHAAIHAGRLSRDTENPGSTGEPDARKPARPVREGADGKVPAWGVATRRRPTLYKRRDPRGGCYNEGRSR
jgi:group II intron reverse transcriptase/maturase